MARTDISTVKGIITTGLEDADITQMIGIANRMVTDNLNGKGLSTNTLTDIETYLTAHIIASTKERQAMTEKVGEVSVTYQGTFTTGLKLTTYGQMALMLDTSGTLQGLSKQKAYIKAVKQVDPTKYRG